MKLPKKVGLITLPETVLFPHSLLPLHLFEPHYRIMVEKTLKSHRMIAVAMEDPGGRPMPIAGLGIIRVCVSHKDGTSSVVLQGLKRIKCTKYVHDGETDQCEFEVLASHHFGKREVKHLMEEIFKEMDDSSGLPREEREIDLFLRNVKNYDTFVDLLAGSLINDVAHKQSLMEISNTRERVEQMARWLKIEHSK